MLLRAWQILVLTAKQTVEAQLKRLLRKNNSRGRDHSVILLAENMAAFCPCPNNLLEAKLKSTGLMSLTGKI